MSRKVKVPVHGKVMGTAMVEDGATEGAIVGVNLRTRDGRIIQESDLGGGTTVVQQASPGGGVFSSLWRLIREVPANLLNLAELATAGLVTRKSDDTFVTRTLTGTAGRITVANGDGDAGNPTVDLAELADSGTGSGLVKITRDGYGRVSGTQTASTSDLAEGTNLYFTDARVYTKVKAALVAGSNVTITPNDGAQTLTIAASGGGGSGEVVSFDIAQTAHGFSVGDVVRSDGTADSYTEAQADSAANAEVVGIVTAVADVDNFTITSHGIITAGVPAATAGTVYFLDPSTAGALTATEPTTAGHISKPVLIVLESAAKALVLSMRGFEVASSGGGGGGGGYDEGTSFPGSPATNDKFYRTDLNLLCYYDGTRWLTVQTYDLAQGGQQYLFGNSANNGANPFWTVRSDFGMYLERWSCTTLVVSPNSGSAYWNVSLDWLNASNSGTSLASFNTSADTAVNWVNHDQTLGVVLSSSARAIRLQVSKTGSPGVLYQPTSIIYRLIVT